MKERNELYARRDLLLVVIHVNLHAILVLVPPGPHVFQVPVIPSGHQTFFENLDGTCDETGVSSEMIVFDTRRTLGHHPMCRTKFHELSFFEFAEVHADSCEAYNITATLFFLHGNVDAPRLSSAPQPRALVGHTGA